MKDPPAGFISHEIFKHVTSREYDRDYRQWLSLINGLSTSRYSGTLFFLKRRPFPLYSLLGRIPAPGTHGFSHHKGRGLLRTDLLPVKFSGEIKPSIAHPDNFNKSA
jgi:hypothetical protein